MGAHLAISAIAVVLIVASPRSARAGTSEPELKAEFIERFTRFVDWDGADLPDAEFVLCVLGDSVVTEHLQRIVKTRKIKNRRGVVKVVDKPERVDDCQVVLIGGTDKKRLAAVLDRTAGRAILTVADAPGAAAAGAIVNFYRAGKHVKFEINTSAAAASQLVVRSKLLRLARVVKGGR